MHANASDGNRRASLPQLPSDGKTSQKRECVTFEPQQWRQSVCKNCFRSQPEHVTAAAAAAVLLQQQPLLGGSRRITIGQQPMTSREEVTTSAQQPGMAPAIPSHVRIVPRKPGGSGGQRPIEDVRGPSNTITQLSSPSPIYERRGVNTAPSTPPTQAASGIFSSASSIDARYVEELENDFFDLEDKYDALIREKQELTVELAMKMRSLEELQLSLEANKEKFCGMERRCTHLEEEIKTYRERLRLPESDQGGGASDLSVVKASSPTTSLTGLEGEGGDDLRQRLNQVEQLCQDVMEENEVLKEEIEEMQREIEEMHDHFQEEDRDSMREMQRDLEAANKTCRILQFKLKKAERRFEQCEAERANLEERLARLESELYSETDVAHIRTIEEELRVSKEVGVRLNNELDMLEEKKNFYEDENHQLKDELQCCQNRRISSENEVDRLRLELEKIKIDTGFSEQGPLQVTDKRAGRRQASPQQSATLSREPSQEDNELLRDLQMTKEREADLSEQLRFAEEEVRKLKRRIGEAQSDNDVLTRQIERVNNAQAANARGSSPRATASSVKKDMPTFESPTETDRQRRIKLEPEISSTESRGTCLFSRPSEDRTAEKIKQAEDESQKQKELNKATLKRLNQVARDFVLLKAADRADDWFSKYNEAIETQHDYEAQVLHLKKKLSEQMTNSVILQGDGINKRKIAQANRLRAEASKDGLISELESYEKELDELEGELATVKNSVNCLRTQIRKNDEDFSDYKTEAEQRERDLRMYAEQLEKKDFVAANLVDLMVQRTELLLTENERLALTETKKPTDETVVEDRLKNLEQLLEVEHQRVKQLETELNVGENGIRRPMISENERTRLREIDLLKGQLEEKEELIDDYESQIRELNSRVDRAKKMNDVMKTLIDKDPVEAPVGKSIETKQTAIEINSYRREIDSMRKEIAILQQKATQMEKVREKLLYENKEMQEELKLREDSLFDQDDELEKRNADLAKAKQALELMQNELVESRKELAAAKTHDCGGTSGKLGAQIAENDRLKANLRLLDEELKTKKEILQKSELHEKEALDRFKHLSEVLSAKEAIIREKDILILDSKKEARKLDEDLIGAKKKANDTIQQLKETEKIVCELQKKLSERDRDTIRHLSITSSEASPAMPRRLDPSASPDSALGSRENTLRRGETDRLRREVFALKQERDEIAKEARKERQHFENKLAELNKRKTSLTESQISLGPTTAAAVTAIGDLYSRAVAEKQMTSKLALLNEHVTRQARSVAEVKVQNENLQNKLLEYQRRYTNLKEQYDGEQEAWLSDRVVLESRAKEQEDRKSIIASTRKSLQESSIRLAEIENNFEKERHKLETCIEKLETEKSELKVQLTQFREQQKMPKVLQRFGAPSSGRSSSNLSLVNSVATANAVNTEATRRLESAERTIIKLRSDLLQTIEKKSENSVAVVREAEQARAAAEFQMEILNEQLLQLNLFREQAELFRERWLEVDQMADREYKVWANEREDLLCRVEDARFIVEQWNLRLMHREGNEYLKNEDIVNEVVVEMERWRNSKHKYPTMQRRIYTMDNNQLQTDSPGLLPSTPLHSHSGYNPLSHTQRSTSVEWSHRSQGYKGSNLSLAANYGISPSLMRSSGFNNNQVSRCGRSVSPDVSIRKITNYPDPTPGFLVRSNSRLGSIDSISSLGDFMQKPFTMPGKPPLRQPISPARRKFFDESQHPEMLTQIYTPVQHPTVAKLASGSFEERGRGSSTPEKSSPPGSSSRSSPLLSRATPAVKEEPMKKKTPSVLSRISSKLTGSKSDLSKSGKAVEEKKSSSNSSSSSSKSKASSILSKSPKISKRRSPDKDTKTSSGISRVKGSPEAGKKPSPEHFKEKISPKSVKKISPERTKLLSSKETSSSSPPASTSSPASSTIIKNESKDTHVTEKRSLDLPKLTPVSALKSSVKTTRSNSTTSIAPSIMLLRQKFGGK